MPEPYQTRPERLAEERRQQAQQDREDPPRLNPPFPYQALPFPSEALGAQPLWSLTAPEA